MRGRIHNPFRFGPWMKVTDSCPIFEEAELCFVSDWQILHGKKNTLRYNLKSRFIHPYLTQPVLHISPWKGRSVQKKYRTTVEIGLSFLFFSQNIFSC
jgi:hypothetical protein